MGVGTGFGKTILIGDQFVLWEIPAILAAIPFQTECRVERLMSGSGWILDDRRIEVPGYKQAKEADCRVSIDRMVEVMGLDLEQHPIKITVGGDLLAGSGVGASAAICVAFARACNTEFSLGMDSLEINRIAWEGEFGYHGLPSGLDNTVSTFGGVIQYQITDGVKQFTRINLKEPIPIVLGNSGVTTNTALLKKFLESQQDENPLLFEKRLKNIGDQVSGLETALEIGDLSSVGSIMNENHRLLIEMGLSHEKLVSLCDKANSLGSYGAKVTGGGRGGYMVALARSKENQEEIARAFEAEGIATIKASIGGKPTDPMEYAVLN